MNEPRDRQPTSTLSRAGFRRICEDVYLFRKAIWQRYPHLSREAALWWAILQLTCQQTGARLSSLAGSRHQTVPNPDWCRNAVYSIVSAHQQEPFATKPTVRKFLQAALAQAGEEERANASGKT